LVNINVNIANEAMAQLNAGPELGFVWPAVMIFLYYPRKHQ
jgi:hypothetical protein